MDQGQEVDANSGWQLEPEDLTREELVRFGRILDRRPRRLFGATVGMALARALLMVRTKQGWTRPLIANAAQCAFELERGQSNIVLKARQMGLTTWIAARFFLKTITQPGTLTLEVAHTQEAAEEIFRIVHRFVDWMPEPVRTGPLRTSRANVRMLVFPEIDAQYRVVSAGDRNAGRGLTVQNLHCSELARWPGNPAETLAGLRAALAPCGELVIESTPQGVGGCFYDEWQRAAETGMVRHFLPWWMEKSYRGQAVEAQTLTGEEQELMRRHGLSREQIGFRRRIGEDFGSLAAQEFAENAETCFAMSGECVFDRVALDRRLHEVPNPVSEERNGDLAVWLPPVGGRRYVVAVDPAGGGSEGDYSAIQVLDLESAMQCLEYAGHLAVSELAALAANVARRYNHAWLVVERNNHGSGVLAHLAMSHPGVRLYEQDGQPGWLTTSLSRPAVLAGLDVALVDAAHCFHSRRLLAECRSFVRHGNGKIGARAGAHDDLVMAMAIALAARAELLSSGGADRRA